MPADTGVNAGLRTDRVTIIDDFLSPQRTAGLAARLRKRQSHGEFAEARIGAGMQSRQRADIRGDETCWLAEPLFMEERALLDDLEQLRQSINRGTLLGLFDLELHYACYATGRGYARHVDQLHGQQQRCVSLVLYLNAGWQSTDGGELRLFHADGSHLDIAPCGGRLVCFLTEGREHAVLAPQRERLSISGWFRTRACTLPRVI